jgi:hypothetical protein
MNNTRLYSELSDLEREFFDNRERFDTDKGKISEIQREDFQKRLKSTLDQIAQNNKFKR